MYVMVLLACTNMMCEDLRVIGHFPTLAKCEAALNGEFEKLDAGQAIMCVRDDREEVQT